VSGSPRPGTVAVCQVAPRLGEVEANLDLLRAEVREAAAAGAELVVLPELATTGYVLTDRAHARALAEPVSGAAAGRSVRALQEVAATCGVAVVCGIAELGDDGETVHNSAVLVDGAGVRATYRKAHLWGREPELFDAGTTPPPVVDLGWARVGVVVCYDLEFPEWVGAAALGGADVLCAPVNWPAADVPAGERPVEMVTVQAAAAVNGMYVAACDRVGREAGVDWVGGSVVAGPDGYPLAVADLSDRPQRLLASVDPARARDKSVGERNDRFGDRRPELY
jgi:predicted amidohydrolase